MEIGGNDCVIPVDNKALLLRVCIRVINRYWAAAKFEIERGGKYETRTAIPYNEGPTVFVYLDRAAERSWDDDSVAGSSINSMIQVIPGNSDITLVVDDPAGPNQVAEILAEIRALVS